MPLLLPLLYASVGAGAGAYFEAKNKEDSEILPQASELLKVNSFDIAKYAVLGLGVYWIARKTGAIRS